MGFNVFTVLFYEAAMHISLHINDISTPTIHPCKVIDHAIMLYSFLLTILNCHYSALNMSNMHLDKKIA